MAEIIPFPARRAPEPTPAPPGASREIQQALAHAALLADVTDLTGLAIVLIEADGREVVHRVGDPVRIADALARMHRETIAEARAP
jgi:hypothetical protein